jgi:GNAT superfamily N-acetyltransferase
MSPTVRVRQSQVIPAADPKAWDAVLDRFPPHLNDIHLTARYHHLYERNGDGQARLFAFQDAGEWYCTPFLIRPVDPFLAGEGIQDIETAYGYAGPVSTTEDAGFLASADEAFREFCRQEMVVTEFVRFHPLMQNQRFIPPSAGMQVVRLRDYVTVDLSAGTGQRMERYTPQNRNKLRKAEKADIHIVEDPTVAHFSTFVDIYLENMRQLGAARMYYFSESYFHELRELVRKDGVLLLALGPSGVHGAAVFLLHGPWSHYFLSSVTSEGRQLGVGNLLLHEGINWAADRGAKVMHLGGGLTADPEDPLLSFKMNFSRDTVPFHIGKRIHDADKYRAIIEAWEYRHGVSEGSFGSILQRYRWNEEDLRHIR